MAGIDAYTKLMLHGDKIDASVSKAISPIGDAMIKTAEFKFNDSSAYFDGTGDYLTISPDDDLNFGSGEFTVDFWVRPASDGTTLRIYGDSNAGDSDTGIRIRRSTANKIVATLYDTSLNATEITSSTDVLAGSWYHVAFVRTVNTLKLFINGTQEGGDQSFSATMRAKANGYRIGRHGDLDSGYFFGYIDEFRVSKGIARWTGNFAVPTSKYISDQYTALLLHFTGANNSIIFADASGGDESGNEKVVTYNGNAQTDTAQSKFGNSSILFDGTADYLTVPDSDDWFFDTGDFTIDFWVRYNQLPSTTGKSSNFYKQRVDDNNAVLWNFNAAGLHRFLIISGGVFQANYTYPWSPSINIWYHIALVRNGTSLLLFIDGDLKSWSVISTAISTNSSPNLAINLEIGGTTADTQDLDGWLEEYRISKGIARWTANFTPEAVAYSEPVTSFPKTQVCSVIG